MKIRSDVLDVCQVEGGFAFSDPLDRFAKVFEKVVEIGDGATRDAGGGGDRRKRRSSGVGFRFYRFAVFRLVFYFAVFRFGTLIRFDRLGLTAFLFLLRRFRF